MAEQDVMSPESSPGASGVRRANNVPLYLLGAVGMGFVGVMATVAWQRAAQQQQQVATRTEAPATKSSLAMAKAMTANRANGVIEPKGDAPPAAAVPASSAIPVARPEPEDLDRPPQPPGSSGMPGQHTGSGAPAQQPLDQEGDRIRQARMQQFEAALRSRTTVQLNLQGTSGAGRPAAGGESGGTPGSREDMLARLEQLRQQAANVSREDTTATYTQRVAQLQAAAGGPGGAGAAGMGGPSAGAAPTPSRTGMAQFGHAQGGNRWRLDSHVQAPESPYMLLAGSVIPAILKFGINSELPGQITAQVSRNIYDTATGRHLLIPQGAELLGAYSSEGAYGQSRVLVAWQRITFPDGKTLDIGAMPGADPEGYAGFKDKVNHHYLRTWGQAFLMSGVVAGIALSQRSGQSVNSAPTASSAMSEALGQQLGQVTAQMIARNLSLASEREIRPGFRFNVVVTADMKLPGPFQPFDYAGAQR